MTFRKDSLLFYQSEIFYIVMTVLCLAIVPILGKLSLLCLFSFLILIFVNPILHNEYITISEVGVSCQKSGKLLWTYEWDCVAELKRRSRFLMPSIEVVVYNKYRESNRFSRCNQYFLLGRAAKEAMRRYYKSA